eukprot:8998254-Ditylum_brightwellii.AAC.1
MKEQLGLLTTDNAGERLYCEASRDYSIKNTIFFSKTPLGNDLLCGMYNDGNEEDNGKEEKNSDDSSCSSTESCFDEEEERDEDETAFKFADVPEFQSSEVVEDLKHGWCIIEVYKLSKNVSLYSM